MPKRLENDRWLFSVTLALCLLGAVMIYSASAVTADQQYGRSYIFLLRQAAWLLLGLLGMFALMRTDYRRLREPAVVYPTIFLVLLMLIGAFFLDKTTFRSVPRKTLGKITQKTHIDLTTGSRFWQQWAELLLRWSGNDRKSKIQNPK